MFRVRGDLESVLLFAAQAKLALQAWDPITLGLKTLIGQL
jgi:hypothetical protein